MGEPLSMIEGGLGVFKLYLELIKYVGAVKNADEDRNKLLGELIHLRGILETLGEHSREEPARPILQDDRIQIPSLLELERKLEHLRDSLQPRKGLRKLGDSLIWPLRQGEIKDSLAVIERFKSILMISLQQLLLLSSRNTHLQLDSISSKVDQANERLERLKIVQIDQEILKLLNWISTTNFRQKHQAVMASQMQGTLEWFFTDVVFRDWVASDERILWCSGMPGAGKTVLALTGHRSAAIEYLRDKNWVETTLVLFAYCSYKEKDQSPSTLIAAMLRQAIEAASATPNDVLAPYREHMKNQTRPLTQEYVQSLELVIKAFPKVFIVVDALDELSESVTLVFDLLKILKEMKAPTRVLITSRDLAQIGEKLLEFPSIKIRARDEGVMNFCASKLDQTQYPRLQSVLDLDSSLRDNIIDTITSKAQGMFLLAQLHLDAVGMEMAPNKVRKALERLPNELKGTYKGIMERIQDQDSAAASLAFKTLMWICLAERPLTAVQLQHAAAMESDTISLDEGDIVQVSMLLDVCQGLIVLDSSTKVIRLVHYTAQEFFESKGLAEYFQNGHARIAKTCLLYLGLPKPDAPPRIGWPSAKNAADDHLVSYAAYYCAYHADLSRENSLQTEAMVFLNSNPSDVLNALYELLLDQRYPHWNERVQLWSVLNKSFKSNDLFRLPPLTLAAFFGLNEAASSLLKQGADVNETVLEMTPLSVSLLCHRLTTTLLLLESGADISSCLWTLLHVAMRQRNQIIIQRVIEELQHRDDIPRASWNSDYQDVYHYLFRDEQTSSVSFLDQQRALLRIIIEKGLDTAREPFRISLLHAAASDQKDHAVRRLIEEGANPNREYNDDICTSLTVAVHFCSMETIQIMLNAKVKPSVDNLRLAFLFAVCMRKNDTAKIILQSLFAQMHNFDTSFQTQTSFLQTGVELILEELPDRGAWLSVRSVWSSYGWNLLIHAVNNNNLDMTQRLLSKGAVPKIVGVSSGSPSEPDIGRLSINVLRALIEAGLDIEATDREGRGLLHQAVRGTNGPLVEELVRLGCDLETKDLWGKTPFLWFLSCHDVLQRRQTLDFLELLKAQGVDIYARDREGNTAFHSMCCDSAYRNVSFNYDTSRGTETEWLLRQGVVDPKLRNEEGKTALDYAIDILAEPPLTPALAIRLIPVILLLREA